MGEIGKYATKVRGGHQSGGDVLYGGGTGGDLIWIGVLGPANFNRVNSGRDTHRIPVINNGEAITVEDARYMVYNGGRGSEERGGGAQLDMNYIGHRQGTVAQWEALIPKLEVSARKKGYKGVGCRRDLWLCQEAPETQLRETLDTAEVNLEEYIAGGHCKSMGK